MREYTSTKTTGIKAIDEVFRTATQPLREATDLRENMQKSSKLVSFSHFASSPGMGFHKELHRLEAKEGLKGRKLQKALESFAWNITVLKGQADLLKHSKAEALDTLWQIHNAAQSCGIGQNGAASPDLFRSRTVLDPIPETEGPSDVGSSC
ncbi:hypothetical protein JRQ81_005189 [Phrynocephalus forsythii]|uniref:Uncharacterized protein n=1 Tax=Phrynocephalus forsythii TaxID=171643 RepID=A0A9Q0XJC6_9SAUR|nr:hypothetical protein JRQ81_005189 [Phrynocephalus forsythii]